MALSMKILSLFTILTVLVIAGCGAKHESAPPQQTVKKGSEIATTEQREFIERQKEEMRKQERELQDLRRQKFHDDYFRSQYQK
jgi:hypothetical protein